MIDLQTSHSWGGSTSSEWKPDKVASAYGVRPSMRSASKSTSLQNSRLAHPPSFW
jgi:hypothetical protein